MKVASPPRWKVILVGAQHPLRAAAEQALRQHLPGPGQRVDIQIAETPEALGRLAQAFRPDIVVAAIVEAAGPFTEALSAAQRTPALEGVPLVAVMGDAVVIQDIQLPADELCVIKELDARAKALLARYRGEPGGPLRVGELVLPAGGGFMTWKDRRVKLTKTEAAIMRRLAVRPLPHLTAEVLAAPFRTSADAIYTHIGNIKKRIEQELGADVDDPHLQAFLASGRSNGYTLAPAAPASAAPPVALEGVVPGGEEGLKLRPAWTTGGPTSTSTFARRPSGHDLRQVRPRFCGETDRLPPQLRPAAGGMVPRPHLEATLDARIGPGTVVPVEGPQHAGKTQLVSRYLVSESFRARCGRDFPNGAALIALSLRGRVGGRRVLRALAHALEVGRAGPEEGQEWTDGQARAHLLGEVLPMRLGDQDPLLVVDDWQAAAGQADERADLDALLATDLFRNGVAIVVSRNGVAPDARGALAVRAPVQVGGLDRDEAARLLGEVTRMPDLAREVLDVLGEYPETRLPGVLTCTAGTFEQRLARGEPAEALTMLEALLDATRYVVEGLLEEQGTTEPADAAGEPTAFATLLALAILGPLPFNAGFLTLAGLPVPPLDALQARGWVGSEASGVRLTRIPVEGLRRTALDVLKERKASAAGAAALRTAVGRLVAALEGDERLSAGASEALEDALAWLYANELAADDLALTLAAELARVGADDLFFPLSTAESEDLLARLDGAKGMPQLTVALIELVVRARHDHDGVGFARALARVTEAAAQEARLTAAHLRALDSAAKLGASRFGTSAEVFRFRDALCTPVAALGRDADDPAVAIIAGRWFATTATEAAELGRRSDATELLALAEDMAKQADTGGISPEVRGDYHALRAQCLGVRARLSPGAGRSSVLKLATDEVLQAVRCAPRDLARMRAFLRAATLAVEELGTDPERLEVAAETMGAVESLWGPRRAWPTAVTASAARFQREVALALGDPATRLDTALQAARALEVHAVRLRHLAELGDARALVSLARAHALVASCHTELGHTTNAAEARKRALTTIRLAAQLSPDAGTWLARLQLENQHGLDVTSFQAGGEGASPFVPSRGAGDDDLEPLMKAAFRTFEGRARWTQSEARLALWIHRRRWSQQGSISRHARSLCEGGFHPPANVMKSKLTQVYERRMGVLAHVEQLAGPQLEVLPLRVTHEIQYRRALAQLGEPLDLDVHLGKHLTKARELWPDQLAVDREEARIMGYLWRYDIALPLYRRVLEGTLDGRRWRALAVEFAEVLYEAARYGMSGPPPDAPALLAEACALMDAVSDRRDVAREVSLVRDLIRFAAGLAVDWVHIGRAYELVIGDVNGYLRSIGANLDALLDAGPEAPRGVGDIVRQDFTGEHALRSLGSLFLARAEQGGATALEDARRAYAAFGACSLLERSFFRGETNLGSYHRARVILVAARITGSLDPMDVDAEGAGSLLQLAERLFQSAAGRSAGRFREECLGRLEEARRLRQSLAAR